MDSTEYTCAYMTEKRKTVMWYHVLSVNVSQSCRYTYVICPLVSYYIEKIGGKSLPTPNGGEGGRKREKGEKQ